MIRNCIICSVVFNDEDLIEDARLSEIYILCNSCYVERISN